MWHLKGSTTLQLMDCVFKILQGTGTEDSLSKVFREDIIAEAAANDDPNLQLLVMDVCTVAENLALPRSLRFLFLRNE